MGARSLRKVMEYLSSNLPFPHSFGGGRDRVPAGVRGWRRSQEKLAEKARGDVARSGRTDRKDALQNLEKVEKTHLSWLRRNVAQLCAMKARQPYRVFE